MQCCGMLIHYYRGLGASVSDRAVEIERIDRMLAERAFECRATTQRFGCVISHFFSIVLRRVWTVGNRRATLEQEIVWWVLTPWLESTQSARASAQNLTLPFLMFLHTLGEKGASFSSVVD